MGVTGAFSLLMEEEPPSVCPGEPSKRPPRERERLCALHFPGSGWEHGAGAQLGSKRGSLGKEDLSGAADSAIGPKVRACPGRAHRGEAGGFREACVQQLVALASPRGRGPRRPSSGLFTSTCQSHAPHVGPESKSPPQPRLPPRKTAWPSLHYTQLSLPSVPFLSKLNTHDLYSAVCTFDQGPAPGPILAGQVP